MPTNSFPIQLPDIIIGTYRIIQLPIIPIVPLPIKSKKYKNVKSKYMNISTNSTLYKVSNIGESNNHEWKKIHGS